MYHITQIYEDTTVIVINDSSTPDTMTLNICNNYTRATWSSKFPAKKFDELMAYMHIASAIENPVELTDNAYSVYLSAYNSLAVSLNDIIKDIPKEFPLTPLV